jgi:3-oxoacyl-[acyl-carrier-protein] synthase II
MNKRRVVITGVGLITPLGVGLEKNWDGLTRGVPGIRRITRFDAASFPTQIAGEVEGFNPEDYIEAKEVKKMDRFIHFGVAAATMAMEDSGLQIKEQNAERFGVYVGS